MMHKEIESRLDEAVELEHPLGLLVMLDCVMQAMNEQNRLLGLAVDRLGR